ncbi:putative NADH-dependent fumarate reductase [Trypanosoma cruzi]|uniref:fumarate reductase (NADH) n=2 Tax=Trypanosoma cruzi TaxID=5693 RepID=Q4CMU8_TRYCC|nr:NADH-dependent fumarate reductase, putative [Trypanosoma cruzi]EAN81600.1 NADH-dependent fumarate reductase, putative [Trypanosoma cruzi]PWV10668.1 putative NADH-dependent fumarate reductase [Trypanosoma cruzi]|eukprot:XP_803046.1 NADH-dependent fumarate reductase [Trypanosoma cruzi strain CL Brener]
MADGRSSASVVAVDPEKAARERDEAARALLRDSPLQTHLQYMTNGLELTVPFTLKVVAEAVAFSRAKEVADEVLRSAWHLADTVLNNFNPNSEISMIGRLPVGQKHTMSATLKSVITCCQHVFNSSRGVFDPATGPIIEALRAKVAEKASVSDEQMEKLFRVCNFSSSFIVDLEMGTIARKHEDARFDLGGVSKGYIVDYVVERLNAAGIVDVYFEWGGDCRASGTNARRTPWMVGIIRPPSLEQLRNPPKDPSYIRVLPLNDEALCTSGDYENLTEGSNKKLYTSIFDWKKRSLLEPVESELAQVSIRCYSAMYADALATASLIKRDIKKVRQMLEDWRHVRNRVTNYVTYTRQGERVARMFEIATDNAEIRKKRIAGSLPARVIVVGGGLAGLSAAIEATACGAQVILLEKEPKVGGNSAKATSGINGWGTRAQAEQDVYDSGKYFERDTHKSGLGGSTDPGLVRTLSVKSGDAISWLSSLGVPLTVLSQLGGHSRKRTHRAPDKADGTPVPIGFTIMQTLEQHVRTKLADRVTIMENTTVTSLLSKSRVRHDGAKQVRVYGVEVLQDEGVVSRILADAVILATGGFSNDKTPNSLLQEFAPQLSGFPTTNGPWATGDGVKLARELGVKLVDMDKVQLHPTGLIDPKDPANPTKYLGPEALRGSGGVLLNKKGERFVNELDLRSVVSNAIIEQGDEYPDAGGSKFAFCVLNDAAVKLFGVNSHGFYWKRLGLFVKADTVEKLAALIGCPVENVRNTLGDYEQLSKENRQCPKTRKVVYPCVVGPQGPFYVAFVTPSIHYTMGGCLISPSAEMQLEENTTSPFGHRRPIFGLFGAGEVTGGVHGGNRLGGNSLLECVVFGRIAGDRAATILQKKPVPLSFKTWTTVILREVREGGMYGTGSRVLRFNLPGALQRSGLQLGQFIAIRGEWDGQQLIGYYSPITLPDDLGVIGILARSDKGTLKEWISALEPGDAVEMKGCGGLVIERRFSERYLYFSGHALKKLCLIAGGTGVAPMLQIIRAALKKPFLENIESIRLIYAAEDVSELTYRELLEHHQRDSKGKFRSIFVLNRPPPIWTDGVGFIDKKLLSSSVQPPAKDLLVAICGPPIMQRVVKTCLKSLGYDMQLVRTVDEVETQNSSKM